MPDDETDGRHEALSVWEHDSVNNGWQDETSIRSDSVDVLRSGMWRQLSDGAVRADGLDIYDRDMDRERIGLEQFDGRW